MKTRYKILIFFLILIPLSFFLKGEAIAYPTCGFEPVPYTYVDYECNIYATTATGACVRQVLSASGDCDQAARAWQNPPVYCGFCKRQSETCNAGPPDTTLGGRRWYPDCATRGTGNGGYVGAGGGYVCTGNTEPYVCGSFTCSYGSWQNVGCGAGSCANNEMRQKRDSTNGCDADYRCQSVTVGVCGVQCTTNNTSRCSTGEVCNNNTCVCPPAPACGTRECGQTSNACGNTRNCGTCAANQTCNASGQCINNATYTISGTVTYNGGASSGRTVQMRPASATNWPNSDSTNANGNYSFAGLSNGNYEVRLVNPNTNLYTITSTNPRSVTINGNNVGGVNFSFADRPTITPPPPPPPCSVTTSPATCNITVGGTCAVTASVTGLGTARVNQINYDSYDRSIATVNPRAVGFSPYSTTVTGVSGGSTAVWGTAILSDGRVCETTGTRDTDVNVSGPTPTRDLIVSSFTYPGGGVGGTTNPTVVIQNQGNTSITTDFVVRVESRDGSGRRQDWNVTQTINAAGSSGDTLSHTYSTSLSQTAGNYTALATVDYTNTVSEPNESNNTKTDNYTITNAPTRDLIVSSFTYPGGTAGGTTDPTIIIQNQGNTGITGNFNVSINNGVSTTRTTTVTADVGAGTTLNLTNSSTYPEFQNMPLPSAGTYTALATVDTTNAISESNEGNNAASDSYTTTAAPCSVTTSPSSTSLAVGGTSTVTASVTSGQGGASVNQMLFGSYDTSIASVNPGSSPSSPYSTTVTGVSGGSTAVWGTAILSDGRVCETTGTTDTDVNISGPPSTYFISGSVFVDSNLNERYESGTENPYNIPASSLSSTGGTKSVNNGAYTFSNLLAGNYTITLTVPQDYRSTWPNGSSFNVTVGPNCPVINPNPGGAGHDGSCSAEDIVNLNFGITNSNNPWYQSAEGSIRIDSGINNPVPSDVNPSCSSYTITSSGGNDPGLALSGQSINTGAAPVSSTNWKADNTTYTPSTPSTVRTSYNYIISNLKQQGRSPTPLSGSSLAGLPTGVYQTSDSLTLTDAYTIPNNTNIVLLVNGNLTISNEIHVPKNSGSTLLISVKGNIYVDPSVGEASQTSTRSNLEGIFSTDGDFSTGSSNNCAVPGGGDKRLNMEGAVITNADLRGGGDFVNQRDSCVNTCPSFTIGQRLDFLIYLPTLLRVKPYVYREIAP